MRTNFSTKILAVAFMVQACAPIVPKTINIAFTREYPEAKGVIWKKGPQNLWRVTFYFEKFHYKTAYYNSSGKLKAIETAIYADEIPEKLTVIVHKMYPTCTIFDVFKLQRMDNLEYIFEIEVSGKLFGLRFQENGLHHVISPTDHRFTSRISIQND